MSALRRAFGEHRRLVIGMAVVTVVNLAIYFVGVRPLAFRVATIEDRDRRAETTLLQAKAESQAVTGALTGKERAVKELATFYGDVLPDDLAGARRVTHLKLAQMARQSGLRFERFSFEPEPVKGSALTRVKGEMVLTGTYGAVRRFVHKVETSPDFVVLDDLSLAEGTTTGNTLVITLKLSTYFRTVTS